MKNHMSALPFNTDSLDIVGCGQGMEGYNLSTEVTIARLEFSSHLEMGLVFLSDINVT